MSFKQFAKFGPCRALLIRLAKWRVGPKIAEIEPHLEAGQQILDIGAGNCVLCRELRLRGYEMVPLDLDNFSFFSDVTPQIYNGKTIPYDEGRFDAALLITVLHHCPDPDAVLAEAKRVAKKIIVIEEIYQNRFEKYYTYFIDSLFNLSFIGHPRSNRTDEGWKSAFAKIGLNLELAAYSKSLGAMRRVTYVLTHAK